MEAHALLKGRMHMTAGKAAALTAGFLGAFAIGVAVGPSVRDRSPVEKARVAVPAAETAATSATPPAAAKTPRAKATAAAPKTAPSSTAASSAVKTSSVPVTEPRLHARLKPVLNRGARMDLAADGFRSAEEFATVAHAARNTEVPFMVLKHRVLIDGRTLADAIHESKPAIDAKAEVERAEAAAQSDIATLGG
jgi:hypothetical protein